MKCEQAKEWISLYIDKELSKEEKIEFEKHIKECKECHDEYLSLLEMVKRVNSIEELNLPAGFRDDLKINLEKSQSAKDKNKRLSFKGFNKWTSVAAILVVGVVLSAFFIGEFSPFNNNFLMNSRSSMDGAEATEESGSLGRGEIGSSPEFAQDKAADIERDYAQNTAPEEEAQESLGDTGSSELSSQNMQDKIIYSASMTLQVDEYDSAYKSILQYVKDIDGFIQSSNTHNPEYNTSRNENQRIKEGYIFIRVPSKSFEDAIDIIGEMGNVINDSMSGDNITSQYRDIEVELNNLEVQEERIVEIMKKADKVEDILEIERELNRIRTEINMRKTTLKNWDKLVDYSSIEIILREEKISTSNIQGSPFEEIGLKIQKGFIQSINVIVEGIAKLIVFIAKALPFILILIALIFIFKKWLWDKIKRK
jgi:hypothetical protein